MRRIESKSNWRIFGGGNKKGPGVRRALFLADNTPTIAREFLFPARPGVFKILAFARMTMLLQVDLLRKLLAALLDDEDCWAAEVCA